MHSTWSHHIELITEHATPALTPLSDLDPHHLYLRAISYSLDRPPPPIYSRPPPSYVVVVVVAVAVSVVGQIHLDPVQTEK
jgi:hypothetical protein